MLVTFTIVKTANKVLAHRIHSKLNAFLSTSNYKAEAKESVASGVYTLSVLWRTVGGHTLFLGDLTVEESNQLQGALKEWFLREFSDHADEFVGYVLLQPAPLAHLTMERLKYVHSQADDWSSELEYAPYDPDTYQKAKEVLEALYQINPRFVDDCIRISLSGDGGYQLCVFRGKEAWSVFCESREFRTLSTRFNEAADEQTVTLDEAVSFFIEVAQLFYK